jgi:tetratricopeptide (TPR) repeat protein
VVFNQATVLAKLGRYDEARKIYEGSLKKDPRNAKLYDYYARMLILNDQKDLAGDYRRKAIDLYRKKLAFFPNDDRLHFNLGKNYMIDRQWSPAERHLKRALTLDPRNALYRSTLEQLDTYRANPEMELK